jgi:glycosyltransferase involved in cell wall biosynthesis
MGAEPALIICSKSPWFPAIRREQALTRVAAEQGHRVMYIEQPLDVRALAGSGRRAWLRGLAGGTENWTVAGGIEVIPRASILPPHRGRLGWRLESKQLPRLIEGGSSGGGTVVATAPWQWPALTRLRGYRRVFDCADDWSVLLPGQRVAIREQYRRIADEADAVIVVNEQRLAPLFGAREVFEFPNWTSPELLATPVASPPEDPVVAYAGTLSERLDAPLVADVLQRLAGWRLEI